MRRERVKAAGFKDGRYPLKSGGYAVIENEIVEKLIAPYRPDPSGWGASIQRATASEASELVGGEIFAGFWRVDYGDAYVSNWPELLPSRDDVGA